jgi:hypothetical protein
MKLWARTRDRATLCKKSPWLGLPLAPPCTHPFATADAASILPTVLVKLHPTYPSFGSSIHHILAHLTRTGWRGGQRHLHCYSWIHSFSSADHLG